MAKTTPLKRTREALGLSQSKVAKAIKLDQSALSLIESGAGTSPKTAAKLARYFKGAVSEMEILYPRRYQ